MTGDWSLCRLIEPYLPHGDVQGFGSEDDREIFPHTGIGRADTITPGGVFRNVLRGEAPSPLPPGSDPEPEAWEVLPPGTTCFALITADGFWNECYEAEASVLSREESKRLVAVNPTRRLTRMQVKWRSYVAEYARQAKGQVVVPCDAYMFLSDRIDLARAERADQRSWRP